MICKEAMTLLAGAFPTFKTPQAQTYGVMLSDIPPGIQLEAVKNIIKTSRFLPTVAEIREEAARLTKAAAQKEEMVPEKEWEDVYRKIGSIGPYRKPEFACSITEKTVKAIGWRMLCGSDEVMMPTLRSQFLKTFREIASQERTKRRMNRSMQESKLGQLTGNVLKALEGGKENGRNT